jgi:hypothetical protein
VIDHLWRDLSEYIPGARMQNLRTGFASRVIKRPCPQTRAQANALIEGLKQRVHRAMSAHTKRERVY